MIETQVAQLASSCPNVNTGKLPRQPEVPSKENVSAVTTRGGKTTQEPPLPKDAGKQRKTVTASSTDVEVEEQEEAIDSNTPATQEDPENFTGLSRHNCLTVFGADKEASGRRTIRQVRRGNQEVICEYTTS